MMIASVKRCFLSHLKLEILYWSYYVRMFVQILSFGDIQENVLIDFEHHSKDLWRSDGWTACKNEEKYLLKGPVRTLLSHQRSWESIPSRTVWLSCTLVIATCSISGQYLAFRSTRFVASKWNSSKYSTFIKQRSCSMIYQVWCFCSLRYCSFPYSRIVRHQRPSLVASLCRSFVFVVERTVIPPTFLRLFLRTFLSKNLSLCCWNLRTMSWFL